MANRLSEILAAREKSKFATDRGTNMHKIMQFLDIFDTEKYKNNAEIQSIINKVRANPELADFFTPADGKIIKTEVPVAGIVSGKFVSRRIDRLVKTGGILRFLDYKTDSDTGQNRADYSRQMAEYAELLRAAHKDEKLEIRGYILWLHDFTLEQII